MDHRTAILFIAIGSSALVALVAVLGTYFDIKKAENPRARAFTITWAFLCGIASLVFVAAHWVALPPYQPLFCLPIALLWLGAILWNRSQDRPQRKDIPPT